MIRKLPGQGPQVPARSSQFASRQSELDAINGQIDDLRHRLESGQTLGEIEQLQQVSRQGQHLVAQRDLKNKELNEDLQSVQAEVADRIGGKMMGVLERYFRENGYVVILNSSSGRDSPIVYAPTNIEIPSAKVRAETLDLASLQSIRAFAAKVSSEVPVRTPAENEGAARRLWEISEMLTGVIWPAEQQKRAAAIQK